MLTQRRLKEVIAYDKATGAFTWTARTGTGIRKRISGSPAGTIDNLGYVRIGIDGKDYRGHRLAYLWMTGEFPPDQVDHINGNRSDNSWKNLRPATALINRHNQAVDRNSVCKVLGVSKMRNKFRARIKFDGKQIALGVYDTIEMAHAAYVDAKRKFHAGGLL